MKLIDDIIDIFNTPHKNVSEINSKLNYIYSYHNDVNNIYKILSHICHVYDKYLIYIKTFKKCTIFKDIEIYAFYGNYFKPCTKIIYDSFKHKHKWKSDMELYDLYNSKKYLELMNILINRKSYKHSLIFNEVIKRTIVNKLWDMLIHIFEISRKVYFMEFITIIRFYLFLLPKNILYTVLSVHKFELYVRESYYIFYLLNGEDEKYYIPFDNFPVGLNVCLYTSKLLTNEGYLRTSNEKINKFNYILGKLPIELNVKICDILEGGRIIDRKNILPCISYLLEK